MKTSGLEGKIGRAKNEAKHAKAEGDAEDLKYWTRKELLLRNDLLHFRDEELALRDEKARKQGLQRGNTLCSILNHNREV